MTGEDYNNHSNNNVTCSSATTTTTSATTSTTTTYPHYTRLGMKKSLVTIHIGSPQWRVAMKQRSQLSFWRFLEHLHSQVARIKPFISFLGRGKGLSSSPLRQESSHYEDQATPWRHTKMDTLAYFPKGFTSSALRMLLRTSRGNPGTESVLSQ